jgi:hypothetical protein
MGAFVIGGGTTGENKGDIKDGTVDTKPAFQRRLGIGR